MVRPSGPRKIAAVALPGAQLLDIAGPLGAFSAANRVLRREFGREAPAYGLETIGASAGVVEVGDGLRLVADTGWDRDREDIHTLVVPGAEEILSRIDGSLPAWLRAMAPRVERLVSVCTGALVLAEAGLLDGRRAVTHWESCERLAAYPRVEVDADAIFVRDGRVWTSAGITAGIDLALALIHEDHGRDVAQATARELVVFLRRPGGQSQFSAQLLAQSEAGDELDDLIAWILGHLDEDLSVEALAERAAMSTRHLARLFTSRCGVTPSAFVETARVDAARRLLEEPGASLKEVARATGFGTSERLRRACKRRIGVLPSEYKRRNSVES